MQRYTSDTVRISAIGIYKRNVRVLAHPREGTHPRSEGCWDLLILRGRIRSIPSTTIAIARTDGRTVARSEARVKTCPKMLTG